MRKKVRINSQLYKKCKSVESAGGCVSEHEQRRLTSAVSSYARVQSGNSVNLLAGKLTPRKAKLEALHGKAAS